MNEEFEKMRADFEAAWAERYPLHGKAAFFRSKIVPGGYVGTRVNDGWAMWQASRKQALSEAADKCDEWATQLTAYDSAKCATAETCAEIIREMQKD